MHTPSRIDIETRDQGIFWIPYSILGFHRDPLLITSFKNIYMRM